MRQFYCKINEVTLKDAYLIPRSNGTSDALAGSTWCTALDLKTRYWQVEVAAEHCDKIAFCTTQGLYEFNVVLF